MTDTADIARRCFEDIAAAFPELESRFHRNDPVELAMDIPRQHGLEHEIKLNLQNEDELHFSVGNFWCEWFPCRRPEKVEAFKRAVIGFIAGDYRILEHLRGKRAFKAQLQAPDGTSWVTVAEWATLTWPFPLKKTTRVVRNLERGRQHSNR